MQNQPNEAGPKGLGPFNSPIAALAQPKVVLVAAGLFGLALDLFVRPLSWVALALIVLATAPWILQAWSQRTAAAPVGCEPRPATRTGATDPIADRQIAATGQRAGGARPEPVSPAVRETPRAAPPADPAARQPSTPARPPAGAPRAAGPAPAQARTHPARSTEAPALARPVRPETAG